MQSSGLLREQKSTLNVISPTNSMADYVSAGVLLEVLCYSLVRFPLICGAGLCSLAAGIWFRAEYLDENAHIIRNTPLQSLPDAVDSLRKQVVESDGTISGAFVVIRGVIVPADATVVQSNIMPSGSAVYLSTQISSTPLLASGFLGMVDHDPMVHSNHQLVGSDSGCTLNMSTPVACFLKGGVRCL
jgi:hypothetical protein